MLILRFLINNSTEIKAVISSIDVRSFKFYKWGFGFSTLAEVIVFIFGSRMRKTIEAS